MPCLHWVTSTSRNSRLSARVLSTCTVLMEGEWDGTLLQVFPHTVEIVRPKVMYYSIA